MTADEYKKLTGSFAPLTNADGMLRNLKTSSGKAASEADKQYKDNKKDQPSWKGLGASLDKMTKLVSPSLKTLQNIFDVAKDKKARETLSLADAKKQARALMTKLQSMDDAAEDVLVGIAKVIKEVDKGSALKPDLVDLRRMQSYLPQYIGFFNEAKAEINSLK